MKYEPQSLHWHKHQITIHSGIVKCNGEKSYHPYVSDSRVHDQAFVKLVSTEMLESVAIPDDVIIIIESDNCSAQYKSSQHFSDMQDISNKYNKTLIQVYGIAGHGKGEVDHVGGVAKVAIRQEISRGQLFSTVKHVCQFLQAKFQGAKNVKVKYHIREIKGECLEIERQSNRCKVFQTISGSQSFQVIVFKPNASFFKASPRLCMCAEYVTEYGSCSLFEEYQLHCQIVGNVSTRSAVLPPITTDVDDDSGAGFIVPGCYVAIAPPNDSSDNIWIIKVVETDCVATDNENGQQMEDYYGNKIPQGFNFLKGHFLEHSFTTKTATIYNLSKNLTYLYKATVLYPYVDIQEGKRGLILENTELTEIICYLDENGYAHL